MTTCKGARNDEPENGVRYCVHCVNYILGKAKVNAGHPQPLEAGALVKVDRSKNLDHSQIRLFHLLDGRANRRKTEWPNLPGVLELPLILFSLGFRAFALLRGRLFFFSLTLSLSLTFGLLVFPCLEEFQYF